MIGGAFSVVVSAGSFLYTSYVLCHLTYFLSSHNENHRTMLRVKTREDNLVLSTLWSLLVNSCLVSGFMVQHSLMASKFAKEIYAKLRIEHLERSLYNASTAAVLHLLLSGWTPIPWVTIWNIDTTYHNTLWLTFTAFHVLGWSVIYSGSLMMDISELAGLKQVYYKISARPDPMTMKSKELRRYFAHMRHPSFMGFLIILWIHPFMTIDRVLLSSILTIYMILAWSIDQDDYDYHADTIRWKWRQLS